MKLDLECLDRWSLMLDIHHTYVDDYTYRPEGTGSVCDRLPACIKKRNYAIRIGRSDSPILD